ncbi:MAG TPA: transposase [Polyangia bacterium]
MRSNDAGRVVGATWENRPSNYPGVALDVFVIMPNHVHGVIIIGNTPNRFAVGAQFIAPPSPIVALPTVPSQNHSGVGAHCIAPLVQSISAQTRIVRPGDRYGGAINRAPTPDTVTMPNCAPTLGEIVRGFKARSTRLLRRERVFEHVWQRNYYEHVVRDEASLSRIREYIINNPPRWAFDKENPVHHVPMDQ